MTTDTYQLELSRRNLIAAAKEATEAAVAFSEAVNRAATAVAQNQAAVRVAIVVLETQFAAKAE
jgi:hypothetical protein